MPLKNKTNRITETAEMVLTSSSIGFAVAGLTNPVASFIAPLLNLAALPFTSYNSSLVKNQIQIIIDEFNKLETRVEKLEKLNEYQANIFLLNEYKFFDYCLKEKMKSKIQAYAKVFSGGINSGDAFEENDMIDIQMDIINSLRNEDIVLLNTIYKFIEINGLVPYLSEFKKSDLDSFIIISSNKKESLNEYALRHLINLGLVSERIKTRIPNVVGENILFSDRTILNYSLTHRCKLIRDIIAG